MKKIAVLLLLIFIVINKSWSQGISAEALKPEAVLGSLFTFQEINSKSGNVIQTFSWFFEKLELYQGKSALWIKVIKNNSRSGETYQIWNLNFNYLATVKQGQEVQAASPCFKLYDWPLYVGKKWICQYDFWSGVQKWEGVTKDVAVEKYQEVKVPAGTFQTFKIKISDRFGWAIHYYSSELKMTVRTELVRKPGHSHGSGKWVQELIAYDIPKGGG